MGITQYPGLRVAGPHANIPHINIAHGNIAHGNTPHANTPHTDGNGPIEHENTAHVDSPHTDTIHSDRGHYDATHNDVVHVNTPHTDMFDEDFTTYTEVDWLPTDYLSRTATRYTWTQMPRSADAYAYKDYGVDNFDEFTFYFTLNCSDVEAGDSRWLRFVSPFMLANMVGSEADIIVTANAAHISFRFEQEGANDDRLQIILRGKNQVGVVKDDKTAFMDIGTWYCTLYRENIDHGDTAHVNTPHSDTGHGDSAHTNTAHGDGGHTNTPHTDIGHADLPHINTPHQDGNGPVSHENMAHTDTPHEDASHGNSIHTNTAHENTAHSDTAHSNSLHTNTVHVDTGFDNETYLKIYSDQERTDLIDTLNISDVTTTFRYIHVCQGIDRTASDHSTGYIEHLSMGGPHTDVAHGNTAHGDSSHTDAAHGDVGHGNIPDPHTNTPHIDTPHGNITHVNTIHSNTIHNDSLAHTNVPHVNTPHNDGHIVDLTLVDTADQVAGVGGVPRLRKGSTTLAIYTLDPDAELSYPVRFKGNDGVREARVLVDTGPVAHQDGAHGDVAHGNIPDPHTNTPHVDTSHANVSHGNTPHFDSAHCDT